VKRRAPLLISLAPVAVAASLVANASGEESAAAERPVAPADTEFALVPFAGGSSDPGVLLREARGTEMSE
jgi:hypothetical protein